MGSLVDEAMRDGALGFSTSQLDVHADHEGSRSRRTSPLGGTVALASVLAEYRQGAP